MSCIRVEGLTKFYRDHCVIRNLNLDIEEGEVVVCKGPSGVGKSTFLRCLTYLEPFEEGKIRVGDIAIRAGMDSRRDKEVIRNLRTHLGLVFQFFHLFPHLTVLDNLTIGPVKVLGVSEAQARAEALSLLNRVGLDHKQGAYPSQLSGGQQQRVGIARALAMKPKAVLFDEPTSSLDPDMKEEIVNVMAQIARDRLTMVIVTHEPVFIERIATRIVQFGPECRILSDVKR